MKFYVLCFRSTSQSCNLCDRGWRRLAELVPNVVELDLARIPACSIDWLTQLPKLQKLALNTECLDRYYMQPLSQQHNLRELEVCHLIATDLNKLAGFRQLTSLTVCYCRNLTGVSALGEHLHQLEILELLDVVGVRDLSVVA